MAVHAACSSLWAVWVVLLLRAGATEESSLVPLAQNAEASRAFRARALAARRTLLCDLSHGKGGSLIHGSQAQTLPVGRYRFHGLLALARPAGTKGQATIVTMSVGGRSRDLGAADFAASGVFADFALDFTVEDRKPVPITVTWKFREDAARPLAARSQDVPETEPANVAPREEGTRETPPDEDVDKEFIDTDAMVTLDEAGKFPFRLMGCGFHVERLSPCAVIGISIHKVVYRPEEPAGQVRAEIRNYGAEPVSPVFTVEIVAAPDSAYTAYSGRVEVPALGTSVWTGPFEIKGLLQEGELRATVRVEGFEPSSERTGITIYRADLVTGDLETPSRNLLCNSHFGVQTTPPCPDYWANACPTIGQASRPRITLDEQGPFPGVRALALDPGVWLESFFHSVASGQKFTFSCYVKSDMPGTKAELYLGRNYFEEMPRQEVTLGAQWQRYVLSGAAPASSWHALKFGVGIRAAEKGTTWVTAPQLEAGEKATPYQFSVFDRLALRRAGSHEGRPAELAPIPEADCPHLAKPPTIDGRIDPGEWDDAGRLSPFVDSYTAEPVEPATDVRMGRDDRFLYVRYDCTEPVQKTRGFEWNLVGLVLAMDANSDAHSFLFVTSEGEKHWHPAWPLGGVWDKWWTLGGQAPPGPIATGRTASGWLAEMAIPLSADLLAAGDAGGTVRMNFFRSRRRVADYVGDPWVSTYGLSAWSCPYGFIRNLPRCGVVRLFTPEESPLTGFAMLDSSWAWNGRQLTVNGVITSKSPAPRRVRVLVRNPGLPGQTLMGELAPSRRVPARVNLSFDPAPQEFHPGTQVEVVDVATERTLWTYSGNVSRCRNMPLFRVLVEYDYYTREEETVAVVESRTHEALSIVGEIVAEAPLTDKTASPVGQGERREKTVQALTLQTTLPPWGIVEIPIRNISTLGNGQYILRLTGTTSRGVEHHSEATFRKHAPGPSEVKINRNTLALERNGRGGIGYFDLFGCSLPEFNVRPVGLDCRESAVDEGASGVEEKAATDVGGGLSEPERVTPVADGDRATEAMGGRILTDDPGEAIVWQRRQQQGSAPSVWKQLDEVAADGKAAVLHVRTAGAGKHSFTKEPDEAALGPMVEASRHPAVLATCYMDEPGSLDGSQEGTLVKAYQVFKRLDPYHPAFVNWTGEYRRFRGQFGSYECTDIVCWNAYPFTFWTGRKFEKGSIVGIGRLMRQMREDARAQGKALSFVLQVYGYECAYREPSPAEERCMIYLCLANGFRLIQFFYGRPQSDELLAMLKSVSAEIRMLEPILTDRGSREIRYGISDYAVVYSLWTSPQGTCLLSVNPYPFPVEARFDLAGMAGIVDGAIDVAFEERRADVRRGIVADRFGPHERHVYELGPGPVVWK